MVGLSNKGAILAQLGEREQALVFYDRALEIDPAHVPTLVNKAGNLAKLARNHDALAVCDNALSLDPSNAMALNNKGIALANLGLNDEAYTCFERVTELAPQIAEAWNSLGVTDPSKSHPALSDLKASAASFVKALEIRRTYVQGSKARMS